MAVVERSPATAPVPAPPLFNKCDQCDQLFGQFDRYGTEMQIVLKAARLRKNEAGERVPDRPECFPCEAGPVHACRVWNLVWQLRFKFGDLGFDFAHYVDDVAVDALSAAFSDTCLAIALCVRKCGRTSSVASRCRSSRPCAGTMRNLEAKFTRKGVGRSEFGFMRFGLGVTLFGFCFGAKEISEKFEEHRTAAAVPGGRVAKECFDVTSYQEQLTFLGRLPVGGCKF